jgi:hypothetical protein
VEEITGKGKGTKALKAFAPFEVVMEEEPLITEPMVCCDHQEYVERVRVFIETAPPAVQKVFMSLSCPFERKTPGLIWQANHVDLSGRGPSDIWGQCAIYERISRINHSCNPNAVHGWDWSKGVGQVRALRDIAQDEELTITYIEPLAPRAERQWDLRHMYNFVCACPTCRNYERSVYSDYCRLSLLKCISLLQPLIEKFSQVVCDGAQTDQAISQATEARAIGLRTAGMILCLVGREELDVVSDRVAHACDAATFLLLGHPGYQQGWADECVRRLALGACDEDVEDMRKELNKAMTTPSPSVLPHLTGKELEMFGRKGAFPPQSLADCGREKLERELSDTTSQTSFRKKKGARFILQEAQAEELFRKAQQLYEQTKTLCFVD